MGLFSFGKKEEEAAIHWKRLNSMDQLDEIVEASRKRPQVIFKHSTRCGISTMALESLEKQWDLDKEEIDAWYLDLLAHRDISNDIQERFGVWHQSPQLILIKNGVAVHDSSHHSINVKRMKEHV